MSEIALYNVLTKLGAAPDEAKEAIADVMNSKEVATKADLTAEIAKLDKTIAKLETKLVKQTYAVAGVIIAAVGLMIKFL